MPSQRLSLAQHYHERTKYDPDTLAAKSQGLNWEQQPSPYKYYKIGTVYDLKLYLRADTTPDQDGILTRQWIRLSKLLLCTYGLTARVATMGGDPVYLRSAPSAGGLYPAEVYIISAGTAILPEGLYHYQPQDHTLTQFWQNSGAWLALKVACFHHAALSMSRLAIATSAIFFRSAWRYQDRAYRRIFLDTGHLLGNLELACAIHDFRPYAIGGFQDQELNQLLFLDQEQESVTAVLPLLDLRDEQRKPISYWTALPSALLTDYPRIADGALLTHLHQSTQIDRLLAPAAPDDEEIDKYNFPFCAKVSTVAEPIFWGDRLEELETTILQRRSTRAYTGAGIDLAELKAMLDFTYQTQNYTNQGLDGTPDYFDLSLIQTFLAISKVVGLEDGCYYYAPQAQELRQIRFKNFRSELQYVCLGQELGRDAAVVLFHTADLQKAVTKYGDRAYRYLHLDAGHLGQRLNLAAIQLGLGVSGIAGFFDNQVNELLGIPTDEAVLYITTLGQPG
jgi:SagB-type dehydrogenase family enzyme